MRSSSRRSAAAPATSSSVGAVVDACLTPPFLVDRRVVVVREAGRLLTADAPRLVEVVAGPSPDDGADPGRRRRHHPGAVGEGRGRGGPDHRRDDEQGGGAQGVVARPPAGRAGEARAAGRRPVGSPRRRGPRPGRGAARRAERRLRRGGPGHRRRSGALPRRGGQRPSLRADRRHRQGRAGAGAGGAPAHARGGRPRPVQVLATLHGHFSNMLALDGDDVTTDRDAAAVLGTAPFVAKKALEQSRRSAARGSPRPSTSSRPPTSTCAGPAAWTPRS